MFGGNSSGFPVFVPALSSDFASLVGPWDCSLRSCLAAPTPISQPVRGRSLAAALKNFDRIDSRGRQKCKREVGNSYHKAARPSPLECALAKKGGGGCLLRIQSCHLETAGLAASSHSGGGLNLAAAFGHDNHANLLGLAHNAQNQIGKE